MTDKIKIDIISDVVCPWCIIGYKRLEQAMKELGVEDKFEIQWHPFELNPNMPIEGENIFEHMAHKYKMSKEKIKESQENLTLMGADLGFKFDRFDEMKIVNTKDAHLLLAFAKEFGKQTQLKMRLFEAYFGERKDISNREILLEEVKSIGLDIDLARLRLDDEKAIIALKEEENYWHEKRISSVPTMVFNNLSALNGAYPIDTYKQVLLDLIK
jgi:predicted DsbA family dithiol-disulfide isomerase